MVDIWQSSALGDNPTLARNNNPESIYIDICVRGNSRNQRFSSDYIQHEPNHIMGLADICLESREFKLS
jgi:hypothetical protein